MAISLQKIEKEAPKLIDLSKKAMISLEKVGLSEHQARVAVCLDISGSMNTLYTKGLIQQFVERLLALACRFDDDGALQVFLFGQQGHNAGEMNLKNFASFIPDTLKRYGLEGMTNYGEAINLVIHHYFPLIQLQKEEKGFFKKLFGSKTPQYEPVSSDVPVYVMFLTDGEASDKERAIQEITKASYAPIFWQFMAVGNGGFELLERLDDLQERYLDNADFFSVDSPLAYSDEQLYDKLTQEYPNWLKRAKEKKLIL